MQITGAITALIALLKGCELADDADFKQHTYYKTVAFKPAYPLASLDVPTVAFSPAGGVNQAKGLGKRECWHWPRLQMDVLAENAMSAQRIYEKVCEVVLYDTNGGAAGTEGTYGTRYLWAQGIKTVEIGEPHPTTWDDEGRVSRLVADVTVQFSD